MARDRDRDAESRGRGDAGHRLKENFGGPSIALRRAGLRQGWKHARAEMPSAPFTTAGPQGTPTRARPSRDRFRLCGDLRIPIEVAPDSGTQLRRAISLPPRAEQLTGINHRAHVSIRHAATPVAAKGETGGK
jgi:hypothetical protein